MVTSRDITCDIPLDAPGRMSGSYHVPHSSNAHPFGFRGPIGVINGAPGKTLMLVGGVHGDEYPGPTVLSRLFHSLAPEQITGRVLFLPALNMPAFEDAARCSPLDGGNMNRAFRTHRPDGPTHAIAGWLEEALLPQSDAVIDFHAGGKASVFAPVTMINVGETEAEANLALARAFGLSLIWKMGVMNSATSLNAAASRVGVTMLACELGGAGGSDVATLRMGHDGVQGVMRHLGMIEGEEGDALPDPVITTLPDRSHIVCAPRAGLFDPAVEPGAAVAQGDLLGAVHDLSDLAQPPIRITASVPGIVVMRVWRPMVRFGERLVMLLRPDA
jgi:predicted deacylase